MYSKKVELWLYLFYYCVNKTNRYNGRVVYIYAPDAIFVAVQECDATKASLKVFAGYILQYTIRLKLKTSGDNVSVRNQLITAFCILITCISLASCKQYQKNRSHQHVSDESIEAGEKLAAIYCQSCHALPDPKDLDAKSWESGVLPMMGPRLGIFEHNYKTYPSYKHDKDIGAAFYPARAVLTSTQWQNIVDYYTSLAPDSLHASANDRPIEKQLPLFQALNPQTTNDSARICFVGIDTSRQNHTLLINDVNNRSVTRYNNRLQAVDSIYAQWPVVDVDQLNDSAIACNIGIMIPNNGTTGTANKIRLGKEQRMEYDTSVMFGGLRRPVQITAVDFNNDGKQDYLVCEYGNLKGMLSWFENKGSNVYDKHVIREVPGAIKAFIQDDNNDGLQDIFVLFAQGDESIFLYTNKGKGSFEEKRLLRFIPSFGSTSFDLADINKDGFNDIVYTCGDNADFSPVLKPYHGLYIYLNDGKNNFTQQFFFHINGCFKAIARDFDKDGDIDIATISFFADYINRPEEGFVYFENKGSLNFSASTIPATQSGRWLTMDAGDLDGDGRLDIVLGNFSAPAMFKSARSFEKGPPFLLLKNVKK
ncbi:VCBS repeat-containing protein [Panacibacter sp. DH6]|uniref:VCBS repeat-containing protein n=1 Tax=Panacibacter microcysteis TaxID=2793269 RepID=A0A931E299_9BACT|nr:VCBS repeat-containing protein [Panacibacter microcysteis]